MLSSIHVGFSIVFIFILHEIRGDVKIGMFIYQMDVDS